MRSKKVSSLVCLFLCSLRASWPFLKKIQRCQSDGADVLKQNRQRGIFTNRNVSPLWWGVKRRGGGEEAAAAILLRLVVMIYVHHDEVSAGSLRMIIPRSVTSTEEPGLSSNQLRGSCERTDKNWLQTISTTNAAAAADTNTNLQPKGHRDPNGGFI